MSDKDYTGHQRKVIDSYYRNIDSIMLQKLQELVTELYLAKDTPKEDKIWERVEKAINNLKIPGAIKENILVKRNIEVLARNVNEWLKKAR